MVGVVWDGLGGGAGRDMVGGGGEGSGREGKEGNGVNGGGKEGGKCIEHKH